MISTAQAAGAITGGAVADNDFTAEELDPDFVDKLDELAEKIPEDFIFNGMLAEAEFLRADVVRSIYDSAENPKGGLARSFEVQLIDQDKDSISVGVFSDLVYAEIQDTGDTITPKKKWLAYPHKDAKSYVGVRWPRDFPKNKLGFALSSHDPGGTAYLFEKGREKPVFILKKEVKIPGLRYLDKARTLWESNLDKNLAGHIGVSFTRAGFE